MALNITRKEKESIIIINQENKDKIIIEVKETSNGKTRLGILAPDKYFILRSELGE